MNEPGDMGYARQGPPQVEKPMQQFRYTGVRRGENRTGSTTATSSAALAESLFEQGYQTATVFAGDRLCGQVFKRDGKRQWWGERTPSLDEVREQAYWEDWYIRGPGEPPSRGRS